MQQNSHRLGRNKSSFLCPRAGCGGIARVVAPGHWPSEKVLLAEISGSAVPNWEGHGGPEMPSGVQASIPAPVAPSGRVRLPGLLETS